MNKNENSPQDRSAHSGLTNDEAAQDQATKSSDEQDRDGLPPFVKNWKQLYQLLIGTLTLLIVLFYLFMKHFQ